MSSADEILASRESVLLVSLAMDGVITPSIEALRGALDWADFLRNWTQIRAPVHARMRNTVMVDNIALPG